MCGFAAGIYAGFRPADETLSLGEQGKCPKELAPMSPRLLAHRIVPDWLTRADIPVRPLVAVRRALAARVLGAALTGHPCPGRAGSPSLASPAH